MKRIFNVVALSAALLLSSCATILPERGRMFKSTQIHQLPISKLMA
ncbi:hypothetical protein [Pedobacter endophyticus]|nr:hypothetical protein [Pedobacter endophyticus]